MTDFNPKLYVFSSTGGLIAQSHLAIRLFMELEIPDGFSNESQNWFLLESNPIPRRVTFDLNLITLILRSSLLIA